MVEHHTRILNLEKSLKAQLEIIHRQATVIAEAVYGIQLLLKKGIITREELKTVRETLVNADSLLSQGSGVQPEGTGADVNGGGCDESGVSETPSAGGDSDGGVGLGDGDVSRAFEQGDPVAPVSEGEGNLTLQL